jgi:hypothetical protein
MEKPDPNPVEVYLAGLSARNRRTSQEALHVMAGKLTWKGGKGRKQSYDGFTAPWWLLTTEDVLFLREKLISNKWISEATGKPYAPAAINRFLVTLRGVLRQCWKQGFMDAATYLEATAKLKSVSSVPSRASRRSADE